VYIVNSFSDEATLRQHCVLFQMLDLAAAATLMSWVRQKHANCQWSDDSDFGWMMPYIAIWEYF